MRREVFFLDQPNAHVSYRLEQIQALTERISKSPSRNEKSELYRELAYEHLYLTIAGYSRGDDLNHLRGWFQESLQAHRQVKNLGGEAPNYRDPQEYHAALWTLALFRLFGFSEAALLRYWQDNEMNGRDMVFDALWPEAVDRPAREMMQPKVYQPLMDATLEEARFTGAYIVNFLRGYYQSQARCPWYDSHLKQQPSFFGYWSFELAALAKMHKWPDTDYADNIFYPRDLVEPKMYRTWLDSEEGEFDRVEMQEKQAFELDTDALGEALRESAQGEEPDAEKLFSALTGLTPEEYKENPERLRGAVQSLLRSVMAAVQQLKQAAKGEKSDFDGFIEQVKDFERELERADRPADQDTSPDAKAMSAPFVELGNKVEQELEELNEETPFEVFMDRVLALMERFDHLVQGGPNNEIERRVSGEISESLDARRKARGSFNWRDAIE